MGFLTICIRRGTPTPICAFFRALINGARSSTPAHIGRPRTQAQSSYKLTRPDSTRLPLLLLPPPLAILLQSLSDDIVDIAFLLFFCYFLCVKREVKIEQQEEKAKQTAKQEQVQVQHVSDEKHDLQGTSKYTRNFDCKNIRTYWYRGTPEY